MSVFETLNSLRVHDADERGMSHLHHPVRILPVQVGTDGAIQVFGLRYWSPEAATHAQRLVEIRIAPAPHLTALLLSAKGERLCEVSLIDDADFVDRAAVLRDAAAAAEQAQRASVVRGQSEALLQLIDQIVEHKFFVGQPIRPRFGARLLQYFQHGIPRTRRDALQRAKLRELELAEHRIFQLKLAEAIFVHFQPVGDGHIHGDLPVGLTEPNAAPAAAPRISEAGIKPSSTRGNVA